MKSLFYLLCLCIGVSFSAQAKSELAKDLLRDPNARINIGKISLSHNYGYSSTCLNFVEDDDGPGFCALYGEHVFSLSRAKTWMANNVHVIDTRTSDGFNLSWNCSTHFGGQYQDIHKMPLVLKTIGDYPPQMKEEYRYPYKSSEERYSFNHAVRFGIKKQYQSLSLLPQSIIDQTSRGPQCDRGDVGDKSEPYCHGDFKTKYFAFTADLFGSPFQVSCQAKAPGETTDSLDLTVEQLQKLMGDAVIEVK